MMHAQVRSSVFLVGRCGVCPWCFLGTWVRIDCEKMCRLLTCRLQDKMLLKLFF